MGIHRISSLYKMVTYKLKNRHDCSLERLNAGEIYLGLAVGMEF